MRFPHSLPRWAGAATVVAATLQVACGSPSSGDAPAPVAETRSTGPGFAPSATPARDAGPPPPETICNGVDDDRNGMIDDVDVGRDGVCDCLKVGTLGAAGSAGQDDVFAAWLSARSTQGVAALGAGVITPEWLAPLQVVVAQDVRNGGRAYAPAEIAALEAWVAAGGGFMTLTGFADPSEVANVNTLLTPYGMGYGDVPILYVGGRSEPVTSWVPHPLTSGVTMVGVDNGYATAGAGTVLAVEQGHEVLRVREVGMGHMRVWGDEWITYNTEWQGHPEYQVEIFWLNILKWLTKSTVCQVPIPRTPVEPAAPPVK